MYSHSITLRVRYGETDQMGYMYYGRYAEHFELGRVEALRAIGFTYKRMEQQGIALPVHELRVKYHKPARYDDMLTVRTTITKLPTVRIVFEYTVHNEAGELLTEAMTTLVFITMTDGSPCLPPQDLVAALASYFD